MKSPGSVSALSVTGPGGEGSQQRDFPRNGSMELILTFINGAGDAARRDTDATFSVAATGTLLTQQELSELSVAIV
jgi:hypothetical protein